MTIAIDARVPFGVSQPPGHGASYPFMSPSTEIQRLLGDFYLVYEDAGYVMPFSVAWLYGFGDQVVAAPSGFPAPTHARDLVITDAEGTVVFDSTTADS